MEIERQFLVEKLPQLPDTYEELQQFIGPDATFEAVKEFAQKFSLEDLRARAGK